MHFCWVLGNVTDLSGIDGPAVYSGHDIAVARHVDTLGLGGGDCGLVFLVVFRRRQDSNKGFELGGFGLLHSVLVSLV